MAAAGTYVEYNGVRLNNVLTRTFRQETVFDDSGIDALYQRFTIRVIGYLHAEEDITTTNVYPGGSGPAHQHQNVRRLLAETRGKFIMKIGSDFGGTGGQTLVEATSFPTGRGGDTTHADVASGPKCTHFDIAHISSGNVLRVEAEFVICLVECYGGGGVARPTNPVLSNRWSVVDTINEDFYTTRTYTGKVVLSSSRFNPNNFRHLVVPPLQPGLRREKIEALVSADGQSLYYTITDSEVTFAAPVGATGWNYRYTEMVGDGQIGIAEVAVSLQGDRNANRKALIALAVNFIESKGMQLRELNQGAVEMIDVFSVTETGGTDQVNRIDAFARIRHTKNDNAVSRIVSAARMGVPISFEDWNDASYDADRSRGGRVGQAPELEGPVSLAGAFVPFLQCPCCSQYAIAEVLSDTESFPPRVSTPTGITVRKVEATPDVTPEYMSPSQTTAAYTDWQMESIYKNDVMRVQLPLAKRSSSGSNGTGVAPDKSTSVVAAIGLGNPQRIVRIKATRINTPPEMPDPSDYDEGTLKARVLHQSSRAGTPERSADGKVMHNVSMEIVYALNRPPQFSDHVRIGKDPREVFGMRRFTSQHFTGETP